MYPSSKRTQNKYSNCVFFVHHVGGGVFFFPPFNYSVWFSEILTLHAPPAVDACYRKSNHCAILIHSGMSSWGVLPERVNIECYKFDPIGTAFLATLIGNNQVTRGDVRELACASRGALRGLRSYAFCPVSTSSFCPSITCRCFSN